jgi:hypothetical protein
MAVPLWHLNSKLQLGFRMGVSGLGMIAASKCFALVDSNDAEWIIAFGHFWEVHRFFQIAD